MRATHLVHQIAGEPEVEGVRWLDENHLCRICGEREGNIDIRDVVGGAFTGHDLCRAKGSPGVCEACAYAKAQKQLRHKCWLVSEATGLVTFGWPEAGAIIFGGVTPPASIYLTTSYKKIGVLRSPVNVSVDPLLIQYEEITLSVPLSMASVLKRVREMRPAFTEKEIIHGNYSVTKAYKFGPEKWQGIEDLIAPHRPSGLLEIIVYMARKPKPIPIGETKCKKKNKEKQRSLL